jgi:acetyl esterase
LAPAIAILNHQRSLKLPTAHQVLLHPVVNTFSITSNFSEYLFQDGLFLSTPFLEECYNDEFKTEKDRKEITASPIWMTKEQAKQYMPPPTIIISQCDWLRDQGQNFGKLLQQAGVNCAVVQLIASLHDVEILKGARHSPTAERD